MAGDSDEKCEKKTNKLVYTEPSGEKKSRKPPCITSKLIQKPPICRIQPKIMRVCTRADMKKMVPPKVCDCGHKHMRSRGILGLLFFGMKTALAAAAVYVSYDLGVWGTIDETQEMYRTFCAAKKGPLKKKNDKWSPPSCEAERPLHHHAPFNQYSHCDVSPIDLEKSGIKWGTYWNYGVEQTFKALAAFPFNIIEKIKSTRQTKKVEEVNFKGNEELTKEEFITNSYK